MIEEGFFNNRISVGVIEEYLSNTILDGIDALILGCTHYPLIAKEISAFYKESVTVIDSSVIVATFVQEALESAGLLNSPHDVTKKFFVSDFTPAFENSTQIFFKDKVSLEHYPLWD
jgi:glutamate racemase